MAKKQLTLSVPTPCTEDWNTMTPDKNGKFCASCQKTVVDFSRMTDTEIFNYFDTFKGSTCGRFTEKQLTTPFNAPLISAPQNRWAWALSVLLLPTLAASQTIKMSPPMEILDPSVSKEKIVENGLPIKGEVTELGTHLPISNAVVSIVVNEKVIKTTTDAKGLFKIILPQTFENQEFTIVIESKRMDMQFLSFDNYAAVKNSQLFIAMEKAKADRDSIILRGVIVDMESSETLIGASIVLDGTTKGTLTDLDGRFEFGFPSKRVGNLPFQIVVSYTGYEHKVLSINPLDTASELKIALKGAFICEERVFIAGGITAYRPNFFQRTKYKIKRFFRKLKRL